MGLAGAVDGQAVFFAVPDFEGGNAFSSASSASETTGKFSKEWPSA
jgi:hypothetical protein